MGNVACRCHLDESLIVGFRCDFIIVKDLLMHLVFNLKPFDQLVEGYECTRCALSQWNI